MIYIVSWNFITPGDACLNQKYGNTSPVQKYVQRFIAALSEELGDLMDLRELRNLRYLGFLRDLRFLRFLEYLRFLRDLLLTREVAARARALVPATDPIQYVDLLAIIMGRVLHIKEAEEMGNAIEREVQQLVSDIYHIVLKVRTGDAVRAAALDILWCLLVRSANEVRYVAALAESAGEADVQGACVGALERANPPKGSDAWNALEGCTQSRVKAVRDAVEEVLGRR